VAHEATFASTLAGHGSAAPFHSSNHGLKSEVIKTLG
jgi:hypothetical protein